MRIVSGRGVRAFMLLALLALLLSYCGAVSVRATDRSPVAAKHPRQRLERDHGVIIADALPEARSGYMRLLPVSPSELPKFLSLSFMMFFIVFIFTMTRDTKDALIVTNCGAEAISFLKVYGVLPASFAFMLAYSRLASLLSTEQLFYATLAPFLLFYAFFAFVLYPARAAIHPMGLAVPKGGMSYAVNLLRHWSFSLYYIVSELWGSAGVPLLFWTCANDIIKIDQAKRIYPLISLIGNLGPILSGFVMTRVSNVIKSRISNDEMAFQVSLQVLTAFMTAAGLVVAGLHYTVRRLGSKKEGIIPAAVAVKGTTTPVPPVVKSKKPKLSFMQSIGVLASDKYLRNVGIMVLCYGLSIEFTEIIWKAAIKKAYPQKVDYMKFMGGYSSLVGMSSFVMTFVGSGIVKNLGWRAGALMTPGIMGLLGIPFFAAICLGGLSTKKSLMMAVYVGLAQNVLSKATKYAIFDPTKEMTYIPLDHDSKTKGKAAIDVLGARLGKSGGALSQQLLVVAFGSIMTGSPIVAALFYMSITAWFSAVNSLAPMFKEKSETRLKN